MNIVMWHNLFFIVIKTLWFSQDILIYQRFKWPYNQETMIILPWWGFKHCNFLKTYWYIKGLNNFRTRKPWLFYPSNFLMFRIKTLWFSEDNWYIKGLNDLTTRKPWLLYPGNFLMFRIKALLFCRHILISRFKPLYKQKTMNILPLLLSVSRLKLFLANLH